MGYGALVESMTCPQCQGDMAEQQRAGVALWQCGRCSGIFLASADRGRLAEQENDWHTSRGPHTQPLPRITPDMASPPASASTREARSFVDALFG